MTKSREKIFQFNKYFMYFYFSPLKIETVSILCVYIYIYQKGKTSKGGMGMEENGTR